MKTMLLLKALSALAGAVLAGMALWLTIDILRAL